MLYTIFMLASTRQIRFEQGGDRADLDDCITKYGEALELTPPGHPNRSSSLMNLANALLLRFKQVGDRADLDDCIAKSGEALELTPGGHPNRCNHLIFLALTLSASGKGNPVKPMYVLPSLSSA